MTIKGLSKDSRMEYFRIANRCIECSSCDSVCPARGKEFAGPATMVQGAILAFHPTSREDEPVIRRLTDLGLWMCVHCYACTQVCPADIDPASMITALRNEALRLNIKDNARGVRHVKAFINVIKGEGQLSEMKLALKVFGLALLAMLPTVLKLKIRGKGKFYWSKPIPQVEEIGRLYELLEQDKKEQETRRT